MTPSEAVQSYIAAQPDVTQYCVAYSGGMDSHVLLHLMAELQRQDSAVQLRAVHINHGLQQDSDHWQHHVSKICEALSVPVTVLQAYVEAEEGPEASARKARYEQFASILLEGEHLLLAQHAQDQAETFLLQALRGSGPEGLSGIPIKRRFGAGYLGRPLLHCSQSELREIAEQASLEWVEDPSNSDTQLDRNYLRHKIMPLLEQRWPAVTQTLSRSAQRSGCRQ